MVKAAIVEETDPLMNELDDTVALNALSEPLASSISTFPIEIWKS